MRLFHVDGMSCGHCEKAVRAAIQALQADAVVQVDLSSGKVQVTADNITTAQLIDALEEAGYDARLEQEIA